MKLICFYFSLLTGILTHAVFMPFTVPLIINNCHGHGRGWGFLIVRNGSGQILLIIVKMLTV